MRGKRDAMPLRYRRRNKERIKEEIGTLRLVLVAAIGIDATLAGQTFKAFRASHIDVSSSGPWSYLIAWLFSFEMLILVSTEIGIIVTVVLALRIRALLKQLEGIE